MNQDLTYKVNVDTSDLASQLQAAKAQIDSTLAQQSFQASMPDMQSRMFAFPDMGGVHTDAANAVRNTMDTARLGFQKFNSDMQNLALMTPVSLPPLSSTGGQAPNFNAMSPGRSAFEAATNWGYNPRTSISPGEYNFQAKQSFGDKSLDFAGSVASTLGWAGLAGSALSMAGITGAAVAALSPIGLAAGAAEIGYEVFGHDYQNANKSRMFARDTSWRFLSGRFSSSESSQIGLEASKMQRMDSVMGERLSNNDVQSLQREYTEVGGFDYVRTADEYRTKLKDLISNHTKVLQTLKTASKEASQAMAEWDWMGLTNAGTTSTQFATTVAAQAYNAGYTPTEFLSFAKQSQEMVRGTGIGFGSAYVGGMNALATVKDTMQNGNIPGQAIMHLGGAENAAATITRTGYNFGMSKAGLTYLAAQSYYGEDTSIAGMSVSDILGGAMNRISSPTEYLRYSGSVPERLSMRDPTELYLGQAYMWTKEMENKGIALDKYTWRSYLGSYGQSAPQADLMYGIMTGPNQTMGEVYNRMAIEHTNRQPGFLDTVADKTGRGLSTILGFEGFAKTFETVRGNISMGMGNVNRYFKELSSDIKMQDISYVTNKQYSIKDLVGYGELADISGHGSKGRIDKFNNFVDYMKTSEGGEILNLRSSAMDLFGVSLPSNTIRFSPESVNQLSQESDKFWKPILDYALKTPNTPQSKNIINTLLADKKAQLLLFTGPISNLTKITEDADLSVTAMDKAEQALDKSIKGVLKKVSNTKYAYHSSPTASDLGFIGDEDTGLSDNLVMMREYQKAKTADEVARSKNQQGNKNLAKFKQGVIDRGYNANELVAGLEKDILSSNESSKNIGTLLWGAIGNQLEINPQYRNTIMAEVAKLGLPTQDIDYLSEALTDKSKGTSALRGLLKTNEKNPLIENVNTAIQQNLSSVNLSAKTQKALGEIESLYGSESTAKLATSLSNINKLKDVIKSSADFSIWGGGMSEADIKDYMKLESQKSTEFSMAALASAVHPATGALKTISVDPRGRYKQ